MQCVELDKSLLSKEVDFAEAKKIERFFDYRWKEFILYGHLIIFFRKFRGIDKSDGC